MAIKIEMCSCYLPDDIIFQILILLPVKSLVRFKLVCKTWRSIISHRQFIETHKNQTSSREKTVLVVVRDIREFIENLYLINTPTSTEIHEVRLPLQFGGEIRFVGHCNGLVCLSNERGNVLYLWNPSTNQYKVLPRPKIRKKTRRFTTTLGFGFDSSCDDYKVLSFGLSRVLRDGQRRRVPKAEMYSANADSWVELEVRKTFTKFCYLYSSIFNIKIGEVLYLESYSDIMWFDMCNEATGVYEFPKSMQAYRKSKIFDFGGSVAAIFESAGDGDEPVCSLWALLDDGCGEVSWTKKFNLAPDLDFYKNRVFCFLGGEYFVTLNDAHECIFSNCSRNEEIKVRLVPEGVERQFERQRPLVVKYTESLVSVEGFEQLKR